MKAAVNTRYGSPDVVQIRDVPKPVPKAGEVVVRVHATSVTGRGGGIAPRQLFQGKRSQMHGATVI